MPGLEIYLPLLPKPQIRLSKATDRMSVQAADPRDLKVILLRYLIGFSPARHCKAYPELETKHGPTPAIRENRHASNVIKEKASSHKLPTQAENMHVQDNQEDRFVVLLFHAQCSHTVGTVYAIPMVPREHGDSIVP